MILKISLILIAAAVIITIIFLLRTKEVPEEKYQSILPNTRFRTVTEIIDGDTFKIEPG